MLSDLDGRIRRLEVGADPAGPAREVADLDMGWAYKILVNDGAVHLIGHDGIIAVSEDEGRSFRLLQTKPVASAKLGSRIACGPEQIAPARERGAQTSPPSSLVSLESSCSEARDKIVEFAESRTASISIESCIIDPSNSENVRYFVEISNISSNIVSFSIDRLNISRTLQPDSSHVTSQSFLQGSIFVFEEIEIRIGDDIFEVEMIVPVNS